MVEATFKCAATFGRDKTAIWNKATMDRPQGRVLTNCAEIGTTPGRRSRVAQLSLDMTFRHCNMTKVSGKIHPLNYCPLNSNRDPGLCHAPCLFLCPFLQLLPLHYKADIVVDPA